MPITDRVSTILSGLHPPRLSSKVTPSALQRCLSSFTILIIFTSEDEPFYESSMVLCTYVIESSLPLLDNSAQYKIREFQLVHRFLHLIPEQ